MLSRPVPMKLASFMYVNQKETFMFIPADFELALLINVPTYLTYVG